MKKIVIGIMALTLSLTSVACSSKTIENEINDGVAISKKSRTVEINVPVELSEELREFNREDLLSEDGFEDFQVNEDGSVKIIMTKEKHIEMMEYMEMDLQHMMEELIEAEDTPYIKEINHEPGYTHLNILVDKDQYNENFDVSPLILGMTAGVYQVYDGGEFNIEVVVEDFNTGEELLKVNYPEIFFDE